jgi:hypothetical protein
MSDINKEVVDTYWEHALHDTWDKNCSACYNERKKFTSDNNADYEGFEKGNDFELMGEMSAHPSNNYW